MVFLLFFTTHAFNPQESFDDVAHDIVIKSVKDWPPISDTSPFYSGSDYTQIGSRSIFQLMHPKAIVALDHFGNRFFIPGFENVNEKRYTLKKSNLNNYRLCDEQGCIEVTEWVKPG